MMRVRTGRLNLGAVALAVAAATPATGSSRLGAVTVPTPRERWFRYRNTKAAYRLDEARARRKAQRHARRITRRNAK